MPDYRSGFKWAKREHDLELPVNILLFLACIVGFFVSITALHGSRVLLFILSACLVTINALALLIHVGARFSHRREQKHFSRKG